MYMTGLLRESGSTGVISLRHAGGLPSREGGIHRRREQNDSAPFGKLGECGLEIAPGPDSMARFCTMKADFSGSR
jgi:hypothetical protein